MGIIRKTMSLGTAGLVDFRSDKERTARYSRHTRNAVRAQSKQQAKLTEEAARHQASIAAQQAEAAYRQASLAQQQMNFAAGQLAATQYPPPPPPPIARPYPPPVAPATTVAAKRLHPTPVPPPNPVDELQRLATLHQSGALTDEEFTAAKAKLLGL